MWWNELLALSFFVFKLWGTAVLPERGSLAITEVRDRHGERIGFLDFRAGVKPLPLREIPASLQEVVLLAEDRRFYQHGGIDFPRLAQALANQGGGASTLTQQWVRLRADIPRRWWTKPLVMALAVHVETRASKKQILEAYLNHIPFAGDVAGVGMAAEYYFGKNVTALSPGEEATLAVLIRSPAGLARADRRALLVTKRNALLAENKRDGLVLSQTEPLVLLNRRPHSSAFHYLEYLARVTPRPAPAVLQVTLDLNLQRQLEKNLKEEIDRLEKRGVRHGALVVLDSINGDVLAYVGSADYFSDDAGRIDGLQVARQPGSILKAFTYALAFDQGYSAASILPDTPGAFRSGNGVYRPRNYDERFSGPRRAREALANSLNLPALMLLDRIGPHRLHDALLGLGIPLKREVDFYGVGLTLGNAEITPFHLLQAFSSMPRQDSWTSARLLLREPAKIHRSPLKPEGTWLVTDILKDRHARMEAFGERTVFDVPFEMAAKTGTSTDYRDNWAIAWTKHHVALSWVGNHDQRPMQRVSGITGAGPLVRATMLAVHAQKTPEAFTPPASMVVRPVCALSGMAPGVHCPRVLDEKFISQGPHGVCDWHRETLAQSCDPVGGTQTVVATHYPAEFQAWAHDHQASLEAQVSRHCQNPEAVLAATPTEGRPSIAYPLDGAIFAMDPDLPLERQSLSLRMSGQERGVEWEVNGKRYPSAARLDWPLERGRHVIRLVKEDEITEEVKILVR